MTKSVTVAPILPESPTSPAQIQPPTLTEPKTTAPPTAELPSPRALLKRSKEVARAIKQFLRENPSQQLELEDGRGVMKKYPRIELWQFAGACFGYTAMVTSTEEIISDHGEELGFVSTAHAINQSGRVISGAEAACMHSEKEWQGKPSFQLRSMAQTRSTAKSLRNVLAFVMVQAGLCATPAEEMEHEHREGEHRELVTACYECGENSVSKKRSLETRRKWGKELCLTCEKKLKDAQDEKVMSPITNQDFVEQSVAQVQERKGAQPIVAIIEARQGGIRMSEQTTNFSGWAVVELFGHGKAIGYVTTEYFGAACLFRVDTPEREEREYVLERPEYGTEPDGISQRFLPTGTKVKRASAPAHTRLVGPSSIFALNPCTEEVAKRQLERDEPRPLIMVEMPKNLKPETMLPKQADVDSFIAGFDDNDDTEDEEESIA